MLDMLVLVVGVTVLLAFACIFGFWAHRYISEKKAREIILGQNRCGQICNELRAVIKGCVTTSFSQFEVIPLWTKDEKTDGFQILVAWQVWLAREYQNTIELLYLTVSPTDMKVELVESRYNRVEFPELYASTSKEVPQELVIAAVKHYILGHFEAMERNSCFEEILKN